MTNSLFKSAEFMFLLVDFETTELHSQQLQQ